MNKRFSSEELYSLRTELNIESVIKVLDVPNKARDGYLRFLCPCCSEFQTAVNPKTNLGRCFLCQRNFNTIELVMADKKLNFVDSVKFLKQLALCVPKELPADNTLALETSSQDIS
jgi:DNA primase